MADPVLGVFIAPILSILLEIGGARLIFAFLTAVALAPLVCGYKSTVEKIPRIKEKHKALPAVRVMLACLFLETLGGSAVFVYVVVIGTENLGMQPSHVALAISMNAAVGIPAARLAVGHRMPSLWIALMGICAILLGMSVHSWVFVISIVIWGFCFMTAIPGVFVVLAAISKYPEERVGDAQALMAAGRALGPMLGGLMMDISGSMLLGFVGAGIIFVAAAGVFAVRTSAPTINADSGDM